MGKRDRIRKQRIALGMASPHLHHAVRPGSYLIALAPSQVGRAVRRQTARLVNSHKYKAAAKKQADLELKRKYEEGRKVEAELARLGLIKNEQAPSPIGGDSALDIAD